MVLVTQLQVSFVVTLLGVQLLDMLHGQIQLGLAQEVGVGGLKMATPNVNLLNGVTTI